MTSKPNHLFDYDHTLFVFVQSSGGVGVGGQLPDPSPAKSFSEL